MTDQPSPAPGAMSLAQLGALASAIRGEVARSAVEPRPICDTRTVELVAPKPAVGTRRLRPGAERVAVQDFAT